MRSQRHGVEIGNSKFRQESTRLSPGNLSANRFYCRSQTAIQSWRKAGHLARRRISASGRFRRFDCGSANDCSWRVASPASEAGHHENRRIFNCLSGENYSAADTSLTEKSQSCAGSKIDWTSAAKDALLWVPTGGHGHLVKHSGLASRCGRASVNSGAANQRNPNHVDPFHKIPEHEERRT
jgi:hypothetical protein